MTGLVYRSSPRPLRTLKKIKKKRAKRRKTCGKVCQVREKFVYLQRQNICFGYPVSFRVGAGPYRHRPVLKSCLGNSLFVISTAKRVEKVSAFR